MDDAEVLAGFERLPQPESCRLISFDHAEVRPVGLVPPGELLLIVSGTKPFRNMRVALQPLQYIQEPEYWGIEVVGFVGDLILSSEAPYRTSMFVEGVLGTRGIEVIGATGSRTIDLPADPAPDGWYAVHDHQPPGPARLRVRGRCEFPTEGYAAKLVRRHPQGINPRDLILDLVVKPPTGHVPQVVTSLEVAYTETTELEYDTVSIRPAGPTIPVENVG